MLKINIKRLDAKATLPTRTYPTDAGLDLYAFATTKYKADDLAILIPTKIAVEVPPGYFGFVRDRSSMSKRALKVSAGIVDSGYTGDVSVLFLNLSKSDGVIEAGTKIAQLLLIPIATPEVVEVTELEKTVRGDRGWGHSGK